MVREGGHSFTVPVHSALGPAGWRRWHWGKPGPGVGRKGAVAPQLCSHPHAHSASPCRHTHAFHLYSPGGVHGGWTVQMLVLKIDMRVASGLENIFAHSAGACFCIFKWTHVTSAPHGVVRGLFPRVRWSERSSEAGMAVGTLSTGHSLRVRLLAQKCLRSISAIPLPPGLGRGLSSPDSPSSVAVCSLFS